MGSAISTQAFQAKIENFTDNDGNSFSQFLPAGVVLPFAVSTPPAGFLLCDGSTVSRTTYAKLFAAIGTAFGAGDGSTTFKLPDMRGVFPRGAGTNGTANYGGVSGHTPAGGSLANKGGQKTAKNGITGSTNIGHSHSSSGVSGTTNIGHSHSSSGVSGTTNIGHSHNSSSASGTKRFAFNYDNFQGTGGKWYGATLSGNYGEDVTFSGTAGGQSLGTSNVSLSSGSATGQSLGTSNISLASGSAGGQTLSTSAKAATITGDTETTPASLALNYIIKI